MKSILANTAAVAGAFLFGASLVPGIAGKGLGINCNGSAFCTGGKDDNLTALTSLASEIDFNRRFNDFEHIICSGQVNVLVEFVFNCVFAQNTNGQGILGSQVQPLMQALLDHHCEFCGSIPIGFVDSGDNNPDDFGILTIDAVADPQGCQGVCG